MRRIIIGMLWLAGCSAGAGATAATGLDASDATVSDTALASDVDAAGAGQDAAGDAPDAAAGLDTEAEVPCPSGKLWTKGNLGNKLMQPGLACIACHTKVGKGTDFAVAGTVFPGLHTVDQCYGVSGIKVEIIGKDGLVTTLTTNTAGNFYQGKLASKIAFPYTAKVYNAAGDFLEMTTPQTNGDCNACHTVDGVDGPWGRIVAP
ncbi:MAG: hypothetical protein HY902_04300 [Deltaproteobacteria bacterium]|nr:hypothetical protein [Deltaproteobacteria bacterium]